MIRRLALSLLILAACSKADLYVPPLVLEEVLDNRVTVQGGFCAEGAEDLSSFLKVMLVVDRSNSMNVTDPNNQRLTAAQDAVLRFIDDPAGLKLRPGVEFAVISFFGEVNVHTRDERGLPGFSSSGAEILFGLTQLARTGSNTGYDKALAQAFTILDRDMAGLSDKARARTRYEVIFVSDGMPFPDHCRGESNAPSAAILAVKRIVSLSTLHKIAIRFHTGFASHPDMFIPGNDVDQCVYSDVFEAGNDESIGQETRALLQAMAEVGEGTFKQFQNGDAINFLDFEFAESRRIYGLSNFLVSNLSAHSREDRVVADTDRDGIPDADELLLGTSPLLADSDHDGFSDLLEQRFRLSGLDPLDPTDARCDELGLIDTDGDGLRDCEETFLGTFRRDLDSDHDGIPDLLEVLFGADPISANPTQDRQADSDADGGSNHDEMRWHTNPRVDDVAYRSKIAYDYRQTELPLTGGRACYDFEVRNIRMASTRAIPASVSPDGIASPEGTNRVMLYFAQTPYDDPLGDPIYRMACVEGRFVQERDLKMPARGVFDIPRRRPSDTFRASDVLRPDDNRDLCHAAVNQDCGLDTLWCRFEVGGACDCYWPPRAPGDPADGIYAGACPACSDGLDNDGDGITDYPYDPDCFDSMDDDEASGTACSDGLDNDGDGRADWPDDPGCSSGYDLDESNPATLPECADGIDNDADGVIDFPADVGCDSAADPAEGANVTNPPPACDDGLDNDGDGLVDGADPGCANLSDIDESGPAVCFYCERFTSNRPGQCDIGAGYCKPRAGAVPTGGGGTAACTTSADCRGAPCVAGACVPCIEDRDCDAVDGDASTPGICDGTRGWCLEPAYVPTPCAGDADCGGGVCDTDLGYCKVDPYFACRSDADCRPGHICSEERGFCLERVFETRQCSGDTPCASGACDPGLGWCLPTQGAEQCRHDDECPFGDCLAGGYCDQQSFVFPEQFRPEVDCLRGR